MGCTSLLHSSLLQKTSKWHFVVGLINAHLIEASGSIPVMVRWFFLLSHVVLLTLVRPAIYHSDGFCAKLHRKFDKTPKSKNINHVSTTALKILEPHLAKKALLVSLDDLTLDELSEPKLSVKADTRTSCGRKLAFLVC